MNKAQLIEAIATASNVTKTDAENCLNSALETIKKSVKKGDDVTLVGFGTFTKAKRKARMGRNPQTGKEIKIPAMRCLSSAQAANSKKRSTEVRRSLRCDRPVTEKGKGPGVSTPGPFLIRWR